jgi:hypothetical protein
MNAPSSDPSPDALRKLAEYARDLLEKAKGQDYGFVSYVCGRDPARIYTMDEVKFADALLAATRSIADLRRTVEILEPAMKEIAHYEGYDGSLCEDPEDCPNCTAQAAMANLSAARQALAEEEK